MRIGPRILHCVQTVLLGLALIVLLPMVMPAAEPLEGQGRILVLGDSLAAGNGVGKEAAFPRLLQDKIDAEKLPFRVINAGLSGDTTSGGLRRINWLLRRKIDVLVVELGGNDGLRGILPQTTRSNLTEIVTRTMEQNPETAVVIAGMQMPPNMGKDYTEEFSEIFPFVAKETGAILIPFLLEGIGADPRYNQADLIHPNLEGHKVVAETVWKALGPLLRKRAGSDLDSLP